MCLSPRLKPFWETENIISYDLLWYKSKVSAINPIHKHSFLCEEDRKLVLHDPELTRVFKNIQRVVNTLQ